MRTNTDYRVLGPRDLGSSSGLRAIQHPGERNRLPHMLQPAHPGHEALDAHAESGVRNAAVLPKVEIPFKRLARKVVFLKALQQHIQVVDALASTDDLAIALRR